MDGKHPDHVLVIDPGGWGPQLCGSLRTVHSVRGLMCGAPWVRWLIVVCHRGSGSEQTESSRLVGSP